MPAQQQNTHRLATLPSALYWAASDDRRPQRFYVLLCLALTSIHDRFVAIEERQRGNRNWAATMAYYSIVHAARFLCFQAFGSFPTRHDRLSDLLAGRENGPLNWLGTFDETVGPGGHVNDASGCLVAHLRDHLGVGGADERVARLAEILEQAKELRNDGNYEALLIAHEQLHVVVAPLLEQLGGDLETAAAWTGEFLADALAAEVDRGPQIPGADRATYRELARAHFGFRMREWIEPKLTGAALGDFQRFGRRLEFRGAVADHTALERRILVPDPPFEGLFHTKRGLMRRYEDKVHAFQNLVANLAPDQARAEIP